MTHNPLGRILTKGLVGCGTAPTLLNLFYKRKVKIRKKNEEKETMSIRIFYNNMIVIFFHLKR